MFTHVFCQNTKTDTSEVVDGEPCVAWVVQREEAFKTGSEDLIRHLRPQLGQSKMLSQVLEENLDKDTTTRCRLFFVHVYDRHYMPANCISAEHVAEEAGNVAKPIRLVPMDRVIVLGECSLKQVRPETIYLGKPFSNQSVELRVRALLRATLNDHGWKLWLQTRW